MSQAPRITRRALGALPDGRMLEETTLHNAGLSLSAIPLGGCVTSLQVPDRNGHPGNVLLALGSAAEYAGPHPHLGALVGRFANRIAGGRFVLDDEPFQLPTNNGRNSLHGGPGGFGRQWWNVSELPDAGNGNVGIALRLTSPDGDQGYPGRLEVEVQYLLTAAREWRITYRATCDRRTVVNLTQHAYFNLAGGGSALGQRLTIAASRFLAVDEHLIPQALTPVDGTPFDFREPAVIGARMQDGHAQLRVAGGYDHCWVLDDGVTAQPHFAARLEDPVSGRAMDVFTTEPGLQFYSGNFLDGSFTGAGGRPLERGHGICLETQHFPDSPNRPDFPSVVLDPGQVFHSTTIYRFGLAPAQDSA
jgi:aldose 1-epimerase